MRRQRGAEPKVERGHLLTLAGLGKRVSKVIAPGSDVHGPCFMPGGRQAYMPAVNVWPSGCRGSRPSRMNTSSQTSWVSVPFSVVSAPGSNRSSRLTQPDVVRAGQDDLAQLTRLVAVDRRPRETAGRRRVEELELGLVELMRCEVPSASYSSA